MRLFLPNTFLKNLIFLKGKLVFSDVSSAEKKLFSSFGENPFGIFRHCVINEKFHGRLIFYLNIIEP